MKPNRHQRRAARALDRGKAMKAISAWQAFLEAVEANGGQYTLGVASERPDGPPSKVCLQTGSKMLVMDPQQAARIGARFRDGMRQRGIDDAKLIAFADDLVEMAGECLPGGTA